MKKISQLLIGTNNRGKLREIKALLPKRIKIYSTSKFQIKSPRENGKTFEGNSIIKSKYFSKKANLICLADDSGLEIDILKKAPGIYSARWAGKNSELPKSRHFASYSAYEHRPNRRAGGCAKKKYPSEVKKGRFALRPT